MAAYEAMIMLDYQDAKGWPFPINDLYFRAVGYDIPSLSLVSAKEDTGVPEQLTPYKMRGWDGTLSKHVYWMADRIDSNGSQYSGPGPLSDIVVFYVSDV